MSPPVRLVATDLDGTFLCPDGSVSARAAAAVRLARSQGIEVIAVTARAPWGMREIAAAAGMGQLAICGNGAVLYDLGAGAALDHVPLDCVVALEIVLAVRELLPGIVFAAENIEAMVTEHGLIDAEAAAAWGLDPRTMVTDVAEHLRGRTSVSKLLCHLPDGFVDGDRSVLELIAGVCGPRASVTSAGPGWITIGAPGVSKAVGLAKVCERLGIRAEEVVCVGDELNDMPMLAWVGQPMAVANACPEVLALASRVLPSNAEDGVAQLLEELAAHAGHAWQHGEVPATPAVPQTPATPARAAATPAAATPAAGSGSVSPANLRYLEAAYYLAGEGEVIRRSRLASWLGISAPAVTQGVARLVRDGLLKEGSNQALALTHEGVRVATDVVRRHRIIEAWAVMTLGLDWVSADDEAQRVAPVISDLALERLFERIGRPSCCPHGNHIPGEPAARRSSRRLVDLAVGDVAVVERISELAEHDAHEVLDIVYRARLVPGKLIAVVEVARDGAMVLDVAGSEVRIWPRVASAVWVAPTRV